MRVWFYMTCDFALRIIKHIIIIQYTISIYRRNFFLYYIYNIGVYVLIKNTHNALTHVTNKQTKNHIHKKTNKIKKKTYTKIGYSDQVSELLFSLFIIIVFHYLL